MLVNLYKPLCASPPTGHKHTIHPSKEKFKVRKTEKVERVLLMLVAQPQKY